MFLLYSRLCGVLAQGCVCPLALLFEDVCGRELLLALGADETGQPVSGRDLHSFISGCHSSLIIVTKHSPVPSCRPSSYPRTAPIRRSLRIATASPRPRSCTTDRSCPSAAHCLCLSSLPKYNLQLLVKKTLCFPYVAICDVRHSCKWMTRLAVNQHTPNDKKKRCTRAHPLHISEPDFSGPLFPNIFFGGNI